MPKLTFSQGTLTPLLLCTVVGCGALEQGTSPELALTLRIRLAEPPPDTITELEVDLDPIPYCPAGFWGADPSLEGSPGHFPSRPFDRSAATTELPVSTGGYVPEFGCAQAHVPFVRFFQPRVLLLTKLLPDGSGLVFPWGPRDTIVAYADEAMTFTPFGPTDQPIVLPAGYSVLRRTCGSPDQSWHLQVRPPEDPIDLYPQPLSSLEQSERALLEGCGIQPALPDLGNRVSFDRPVSLAFSGNGQELLFLLPIDPMDPAQGAALRSANLADGSVRELGVVPDGLNVQTGGSGDIYVATNTSLIQVVAQSDGSTLMRKLPFGGSGRVSPDGRWIAYGETVWDVAAGLGHAIDKPNFYVMNWSPASVLVEQASQTEQPGRFDLVAPDSGQVLETFTFPPETISSRLDRLVFPALVSLAWGADGPVGLVTPTIWVPERQVSQSMDSSNRVNGNVLQDPRGAGLVFRDPRSGGALTVLDANAGSITFAAGTTGKALLWARRCLGLFDTVCSFALHRVTVPAGNDQNVAVADSAALVAVTHSGDRIAIAARDGIYVRDLP